MEHLTVFALAHIAAQLLSRFLGYSPCVLFWREINQSPTLKKTVNTNNTADVSWQVATTLRRWQVLFDVLAPHADDTVSKKAVKTGIFNVERQILGSIGIKELREEPLLYRVDTAQVEPRSKSRQSKMGRGLNDCTRARHSLSITHGGLDEIGWIVLQIRLYIVRGTFLTSNRLWDSFDCSL